MTETIELYFRPTHKTALLDVCCGPMAFWPCYELTGCFDRYIYNDINEEFLGERKTQDHFYLIGNANLLPQIFWRDDHYKGVFKTHPIGFVVMNWAACYIDPLPAWLSAMAPVGTDAKSKRRVYFVKEYAKKSYTEKFPKEKFGEIRSRQALITIFQEAGYRLKCERRVTYTTVAIHMYVFANCGPFYDFVHRKKVAIPSMV